MNTQKSVGVTDRLEPSHHALSHPGRLMGLLCTIIGVLRIVMNNIRHKLPMCDSITAQLVGHNLSGFAAMTSQ
jgi:hypothetical protein